MFSKFQLHAGNIASASAEFSRDRLSSADGMMRSTPRQSAPGRQRVNFRWPARLSLARANRFLNRDIRIEKLVIGTLPVYRRQLQKTLRIVTTVSAEVFNRSSALAQLRVLHARQYASAIEKIADRLHCGKSSGPLTLPCQWHHQHGHSPGPTRSPRNRRLSMKSAGAAASKASRKSGIPAPSGGRGFNPNSAVEC